MVHYETRQLPGGSAPVGRPPAKTEDGLRLESIDVDFLPSSPPSVTAQTPFLFTFRGSGSISTRIYRRPARPDVICPCSTTTGASAVQHHNLHHAFKELFGPSRTNDTCADFFAVYCKESYECDRGYATKVITFVNLTLPTTVMRGRFFPVASSALIIDVQSELEPNPKEFTPAHIQDPPGPPTPGATPPPPRRGPRFHHLDQSSPRNRHRLVVPRTSLPTFLSAAFPTMPGKQWVHRYLRKCGGSTADKSRNR